ncbi:MAG: Magnesium and cobalt transport protein CorA [Rhodanobacteraceae bacterium]|jgi:magnesium transporter|nr:MAG: Magnesium and cobalt transport protein CorA [Rhodanobacteraceae bacterium]
MDTPAPKSMVANCAAYGADGRKIRDITLDEISDFLGQPQGFVWVGLVEPDEPLLEKLQGEFGLHELAVEDAHSAHQRPKIEAYGDSLFIVAQTAQMTEGNIAFGETHLFVGKRYLLSVRHGASQTYAPARKACEQTPEHLALGPSYALYSILDFIVDNYLPIVQDFREELQDLEHDVFSDAANRDVTRRLYDMQRELLTLKLAATPLQDILGQLVRLHPEVIRDEVRPYFRDVQDHVTRVSDAINSMREMLGAAMSVNLSLITVRQNEVVKRLAGWAALLAAPTLLASWYGMNFHDMPELAKPYAYPVIIGITAVVCISLFVVLKRAKWL